MRGNAPLLLFDLVHDPTLSPDADLVRARNAFRRARPDAATRRESMAYALTLIQAGGDHSRLPAVPTTRQ